MILVSMMHFNTLNLNRCVTIQLTYAEITIVFVAFQLMQSIARISTDLNVVTVHKCEGGLSVFSVAPVKKV